MQRDPDGCIILPLKEKDAHELATLEAVCFPTSWTEEQYTTLLGGIEKLIAMAHLKGEPVPLPYIVLGLRTKFGMLAGYIVLGLTHAASELEVYNIAVHEAFRQRGFGKRLLSRALEAAAAMGIETAFLEVRVSNIAARKLYGSMGFEECGRRKGYYPDNGEDALVLTKTLVLPDPPET